MSRETLRKQPIIGTLLATAALFLALCASAQATPFELVPDSFKVESTRQDTSPDTQAGAHPFQTTTAFRIVIKEGWVSGGIHDVITKLPPGLVGNPEAAPKCSRAVYSALAIDQLAEPCPAASQIGIARVGNLRSFGIGFEAIGFYGVYLLESPRGVTTSFGFTVDTVPVIVNATVDTAGDYGVEATSLRSSQGLAIGRVELEIWGSPQDDVHDAWRFCGRMKSTMGPYSPPTEPCPVSVPEKPFMTNPTVCDPAPTSSLTIDSWEEQGRFLNASSTAPATTGCELLRFNPSLKTSGTSRSAGSASGIDVKLEMPQEEDPNTGLVPSALRDAVVTMPKGVSINATSADGLAACTDEQLGLKTNNPIACPDGSKLGTVVAETPTLDHPLRGNVYLRSQASQDPASGEMFRMAMVLDDPERGLLFKLPGQVKVDPRTGQVTTSFMDNPPLPVSSISFSLDSGPRAPLTMPETCGTYPIEAKLSPWSGNPATHLSSSITVDQGCTDKDRFTPGFEAGTVTPLAGKHSPFTLRVTRPDGQQNVSTIDTTLPEGVLAKLAGVPLCPEAAAPSGSCPQASQVGTATVGAGAGSNPIYVPQPGRPGTAVYLAGPYKGAPYSLVAKVPAQAGPFDLGTVTVRNAISIDPTTAQVSVKSDPLPQIVNGVPVAYRDIRVDVNRQGFTLNPTDCSAMAVKGTIGSAGGQNAAVSDRFRATECADLQFKPKLALRLSGAPPRRGGYPKLTATLTMPNGGANIEKAVVTMPKTQFLENGHIRTICTRVQYAAKACPPASVYGYAKAWTPLLDEPLQGPVYLRSSSNKLPDLVASLDGAIHIDLPGRIDSVNARIRNTFEAVPDAPVSKFVLTMQGGRKGLLVNNTNLCKEKPRAAVQFDGQNGKISDSNPLVKVGGCGKKAKRQK